MNSQVRRRLPDLPPQKELIDYSELLSIQEVQDRLQMKSPMSIHIWKERKGLPFVEIMTSRGDSKPRIKFRERDVRRWADERGIQFLTKEELLAQKISE